MMAKSHPRPSRCRRQCRCQQHYYRLNNPNLSLQWPFVVVNSSNQKHLIVNHWTLFRKLLNRGVPVVLIRILLYWYGTQTFCIKWGSTTSDFLNVSNGVRQRGILSPYLFIVYIDELSNMQNSAGIGCHIHNYCTNHVFYADDICVIAPSPSGLQGLLNICAMFGLVNDVEYNPIKSLCMVFKPRGFNLKCPDIYIWM